MSRAVEDRIVAMKFENRAFEKGAATTLATLSKLKSDLDFGATAKGLDMFKNGLGKFNLNPLDSGIGNINGKFLAMATIGVTALSRITNAAITTGAQLASSFSIDPIKAGFSEYESNLNAVQTLMSGTGESVEQVTKTLEELNAYSDKTIYSFSDMTANISKFTNAGLSSAEAKDVMIGIANAAASAGVSANEAARAMVGFGQSMSMGFVGLEDWNQVDGAGLATKEFKEELIATGIAMGTLTKGMDGTVRTAKGTEVTFQNLRSTLNEQWLSAEVLTNTLDRYSDTSTEVGKKAAENAQRVKTLTQLMDVLKESIASGWAQSFGIIFGNLEEATKLWTGVNEVVGGFIGRSAEARNKVLTDWKAMDGRAHLIKGISNIFLALGRIIRPIGQAFRDIFPAKTGKELAELSLGFRRFARGLVITQETSENIRRTFRGLFAVLSIAGQILTGVIKYVFTFFQLLAGGGGSVFELTGSIGDLLVKIDEWLKKGDFIGKFFDGLIEARAAILGPIIEGIGAIVSVLADLVGMGGESVFTVLGAAASFLAPILTNVSEAIRDVLVWLSEMIALGGKYTLGAIYYAFLAIWDVLKKLGPVFDNVGGAFKDFFSSLGDISFDGGGEFFASIGDAIGELFKAIGDIPMPDWGSLFDLGGVADQAEEGVSRLSGVGDFLQEFARRAGVALGVYGEVFTGLGRMLGAGADLIREVLEFLSSQFNQMGNDWDFQDTLTLINSVLLGGIFLTFRRFVKGFSGLGQALTGTIGSVGGTFEQLTSNMKSMQNGIRAETILKIAGAVAILTASIIALTLVEPAKLGIAMGAITGIITALVVAMKTLTAGSADTVSGAAKQAASMTAMAGAMIALATAVLAMSAAVAVLGNMDADTLKKGLIAIAALLATITAMTAVLAATGGGATMLLASVGMMFLAAALTAMAGAIKLFDALDTDTIKDGLTAIAVTLGVLVAALALAQGGVGGAVAVFIMANAIVALAAAIKILDKMKTDTIRNGLVALVAIFGVLALSVAIITPVIPMMLLLSVAMLALGAAFALVGVGMAAFAIGLSTLAVAGVAGFTALGAGIIAFLQLMPLMIQQAGAAFDTLLKVITASVPQMVVTATALIGGFIQVIINSLPKIGLLASRIINTLLGVIVRAAPKIANAGFKVLLAFLNAIAKNIGKVVKAATDIVVNFINGIAKSIERIIQAGVNLLLAFLRGIAKAIRENDQDIIAAGADIGKAMIEGLGEALKNGVGELGDIIQNLAKKLIDKFKDKFKIFSPSRVMYGFGENIVQGLANGIRDDQSAVRSMDVLGSDALASMRETISMIDDAMSFSLDMSPVITPVIDMTQFEKDASLMGGLLNLPTITPVVSAQQATSIAAQRASGETQETRTDDRPIEQNLTFIQNNTSPKHIGEVETYRNTRSQISLAKEVLKP